MDAKTTRHAQNDAHKILLERSEALIPSLRARAFDADQNRRVPDENVQEMLDAGILQMLAPARFGAAHARFTTFLDVGINIGRGCGSTSWVFGILGCHHWVFSHFPIEAQTELYGDKDHFLWPLSFSGKGGTAKKVDGGYLVSGRWGFCSGIDFADWVGGGVLLDKENPHELNDRFNVLIPKSAGEVIDTWYVAGMRGTGSRDFVAENVFVPDHMVLSQRDLQEGDTPGLIALKDEYPEVQAPFYGVLMAAVLCPILGITRRVIDDYIDFTKGREGFRGGTAHALRPSVQMMVGEVVARYEYCYRTIRGLYEEVDDAVANGSKLSTEQRLRQKRDAAYVANECTAIVDMLVSRAGARAQHEKSHFQLAQRDIHTIRTHTVLDVEESMEHYGRHILGVDVASVRY